MNIPVATLLAQSGPRPTVLLHGMMMSSAIWTHTPLASQLDGRVIAYALPAHPTWELDAERLQPLLSMKALADAYASAIERDFGATPVDIIGHSTGGFLALLIAAHRPDLVRRVAVISGFADGAMGFQQPLPMRITCLPVVGSLAFRAAVRLGIASRKLFVTASVRSADRERVDLCRSSFWDAFDQARLGLSRCDLRALALFVQWLSSASLSAEISRVTAPVLIVVGSCDPVVPVSHQLSLARQLPLCQSLVLEGVGHLPMMEAEHLTSRAVCEWFGADNMKGVAAETHADTSTAYT